MINAVVNKRKYVRAYVRTLDQLIKNSLLAASFSKMVKYILYFQQDLSAITMKNSRIEIRGLRYSLRIFCVCWCWFFFAFLSIETEFWLANSTRKTLLMSTHENYKAFLDVRKQINTLRGKCVERVWLLSEINNQLDTYIFFQEGNKWPSALPKQIN